MQANAYYFLLPLLSVVAAAATLALLLASRRNVADVSLPVAIVLLGLGWTVGYAAEILSASLERKVFWAVLQFPCIALLPVAWAVFAQQISGIRVMDRKWQLAALLAIPVLVQPVVWTNDWHHWFWREIALVRNGDLSLLDVAYGPAFWVLNIYSIGLVAIGSLLFLQSAVALRMLSRSQRFILVAIPAIPAAANVIYTTRSGPLPNLDLTPFAFLASAILLGIGIVHYRIDRLPSRDGLERLDQRLRLALRAAEADAVYWDVSRSHFVVDDRELGLFGGGRAVTVRPVDMIGIVHPDDRRLFEAMYTTARRLLDEIDATIRVVHPDGQERRVRFKGVLHRAKNGEAVQVSGLVTDVTHESLATADLIEGTQRAAARLRTFFDSSAAAMWTLDANGRIALINDAACRLLDCKRDEVIGVDCLDTYYDVTLKEARLARLTTFDDFVEARIDRAAPEASLPLRRTAATLAAELGESETRSRHLWAALAVAGDEDPCVLVEDGDAVAEHDGVGDLHHGRLQMQGQQNTIPLGHFDLLGVEFAQGGHIHYGGVNDLAILERQ